MGGYGATPFNPSNPQSWAPQYNDWAQQVLKALTSQGYQASLSADPQTAGPYIGSPVTPLALQNLNLGGYSSTLSPTMGVSPEEMAKQFLTNQRWSPFAGGAMSPGGAEAQPTPTGSSILGGSGKQTEMYKPAGESGGGAGVPANLFSNPNINTDAGLAATISPNVGKANGNLFSAVNGGSIPPENLYTAPSAFQTMQDQKVGQQINPANNPTIATPAASSGTPQTLSQLIAALSGNASATATPTSTPAAAITPTTTPTAASAGTSNIDQWLANQTNQTKWLEQILQNAGYPTDATDAWQKMVEAAQRNTDYQAANLAEQFNVAGGRFGTNFGNAMTDFYAQTAKDQSANLASMTLASQEAARARELAAAQTSGQFGFQGASQLSSQNFQAMMQQYAASLAASQQMASGADAAASQLSSNAVQAASQMYNAAVDAAKSLYSTETGFTSGMWNAQLSTLPQLAGYDAQLKQLGLTGASTLGELLNKIQQTGVTTGATQAETMQAQINNLYQEFLRTQSEYSPTLQYLYSGATGYPNLYQQGYSPSTLGTTVGGIGSLLTGLSSILKQWGG